MNPLDLAPEIISTCPPQTVLNDHDRAVIRTHSAFLLSLEDELVALFYDTLYAHPQTSAVFVDGERPDREQTLRVWWRRTVSGELDDTYFAWMALVGLAHIRRKVKNPMMLSMFGTVTATVTRAASDALGIEAGLEIADAMGHLQATVTSLISETFTNSYIGALQDLAGLNPELTQRMLGLEIVALEEAARDRLA